jgi:hypothetical protein
MRSNHEEYSKPKVSLWGRRLLSGQRNDPSEILDVGLLKQYVSLTTDIKAADYVLSLNTIPNGCAKDRIVLLLREPPLSGFAPLYKERENCHTAVTYTPMGNMQIAFSTRPHLLPYSPLQKHLVRATPSVEDRSVYMAAQAGRRDVDTGFGGTGLLAAREQFGRYLLRNYKRSYLFGKGWPSGAVDTSGSGYRERKLQEIDSVNAAFVVCLENIAYPNYISEKIHDGFQSDRVVLYLGEPQISKWVPDDCFIDLRPFFDQRSCLLHCDAIVERIQNMDDTEYRHILYRAREWHRNLSDLVDHEKKLLTAAILRRLGIEAIE